MRLSNLAGFAWEDLKAAPHRLFLSMAGISLGLAAFILVSGLSLALEKTIDEEFNVSTDMRRVEFRKQGLDLGILKLDPSAIFGGQPGIGPTLVDELRQIDTVANIYPRLDIGLPMGARGGQALIGKSLYADLLLEGLPVSLLSPETSIGAWNPQEPVPIWISETLIEIFNTSVAPSLKLPEISSNLLRGVSFDIIIGRSLLERSLKATKQGTLKAVIMGTHASVSPLGAATTLEIATALRSTWSQNAPPLTYTSLIVDVAATRHLDATISKFESVGLEADQRAQRFRQMLKSMTLFGFFIAGLFLALSGCLVGQSFSAVLLERRRDLSLYRGLGLSRNDLKKMITIQGLLLGLMGAILGALLGLGLGECSEWALGRLLPPFPFKPDVWFVWSPSSFGLATLMGVLITVIAGLWPLRRLLTETSLLEDLH